MTNKFVVTRKWCIWFSTTKWEHF